MKNCFEKYAGDDRLLGKKLVKKIIEHIGVKVDGNNVLSLI
jgi:hypothetical protein